MKNVLILGGDGYIGSRLTDVLKQENFNVTVVDICWYDKPSEFVIEKDYSDLSVDFLNEHDVIIVLAGHSSVHSCNGDIKSSWLNNVTNFEQLLNKIDNQLVIYASSASIYGNSDSGKSHKESYVNFLPVNNYDITKYTLDLVAQKAIDSGKNVIGLRFGTVNGWSPKTRIDLMLNSMFYSAISLHEITVTNKNISRAILGLEDLCRAMITCIDSPISGIYNLSSFNSTVEEMAKIASDKLKVSITDKGYVGGAYDFNLDNSKFSQIFNFEFKETSETILNSFENNSKFKANRRDEIIKYRKGKL